MLFMSNVFDIVEDLSRKGASAQVLGLLLNNESHRVVAPYTEDLNHAYYLAGLAFHKQGQVENALSAFKKSYRHWKEDVAALRALGNCYSELGNPKAAKYYFLKARHVGGEKYKGWNILTYNLGNAYFDLGKYDLAISEYKRVRKSDITSYELAQKNIKHSLEKLEE